MNKILLLLLISTNILFSQSKFSSGFVTGYKNGYCHDQGINCIPPNPPMTPIPKIGESLESYNDGYNRGFKTGVNERESNQSSNNTGKFELSDTKFVENNIYEPFKNINSTVALANALRESKGAALNHLQNENYQAVADICFSGLRINPKDDEFMMLLGQAYRLSGDKVNALKWLKKSSRKRPLDQNLKDLIIELESNKRNEPPKNELPKNKNYDNNFIREIQKLVKEKEYDTAIDKLNLAEKKIDTGRIQNKETIFFVYSILAYSHYYKKDFTETVKYSTKSINISKKTHNGDHYFIRALSKSELGDYYGANKDYDYLINNYKSINYNEKQLPTLLNNKAYNLILLKKYKEAEPLINKSLALDSKIDYIWATKGELEYYLENYIKAIEATTKAINIKKDANPFYYRGLSEIKLGNTEKGCSDLSTAGEMGESKAYEMIKKHCN